jgi:hypothetical protein
MTKNLLLIILVSLFFACKDKKVVTLAKDDEEVSLPEFLEYFHPLKTPYQVTDTIFHRKESESTLISAKLFTRLVPDSILTHYFGKELKPRLYAVGRIKVPKEETYLFVKAMAKDRRVLYVLCFDKEDRFAAARPVIYQDNEPAGAGTALAGMDNKYTLTVSHQRKAAGGQIFFKRDAYVFNTDAHGFMLILTESNETKPKIPAIYDPIDTLPRKHKFSGDYAQDKRNIISVRDGRDPSRMLFFIHFEKDDATCNGELKGEAKFVSPGIARYKSYSDPCAIEFSFGAAGLSIKELGGCGVHRDIKCFFEGYYASAARRPHRN